MKLSKTVILFPVTMALLLSAESLSSTVDDEREDLNGHIVAPEHHKLRYESRLVRVLEVVIPPGDVVPYHLHDTPAVFIVLKPARLQLLNAEGDVLRTDERTSLSPGSNIRVFWEEPKHWGAFVENIDEQEYIGIRVEFKVPFVDG